MWPHGADWLFEAAAETYLPFVAAARALDAEGVPWKATVGLTPVLCEQLRDPRFARGFRRYVKHRLAAASRDAREFARDGHLGEALARAWRDHYGQALALFEALGGDVVAPFAAWAREGKVEAIASAATHGFLPLMINANAARAQIHIAANHYEKHLGRRPRGIWLAECGYTPGVEKYIKEAGINYFLTDTHGILFGTPRPRYGVFAPVYTPESNVAVFGRDRESSKQVWSAKEGYPGDFDYRDFYRDIGFDLDYEYIRPFLHADGNRIHTGIKYHRITGPTDHKEPYRPAAARERAAEHAGNFMFNRERQIEHLSGMLGIKPIIVSPYDAELFGHWWFEGPEWIEFLLRKLHFDQETIAPITPSEYLQRHPRLQVLQPSMSSWGYKGYNEFWLEGSNDWIYPHLHWAAGEIEARGRLDATGLAKRALDQAARELLLAQASDWAFMMSSGATSEYGVMRTKTHVMRLRRLKEQIEAWLPGCCESGPDPALHLIPSSSVGRHR